ncbi:MAG: polyprenyl synthetase family protein [Rhizobiaceae bacterium]
MSNNPEFEHQMSLRARQTIDFLDSVLGAEAQKGELTRPPRLLEAMRYAVLNGGKRLRPFLLMEMADLFGANGEAPLRAASALECVHCYSLVHDDLPAMDDDDLRRGKPTLHKAFDEATAILAGDSLLTIAFDILADNKHCDTTITAELVVMLARAAGIGGMAGGQILDLDGEGQSVTAAEISLMQSMKTGALIRYACEAGAVIAKADAQDRQAAIEFGKSIGEAFQLADDILDVTATTESLGKKSAKDCARGKPTLVAQIGLEECRKRARNLLNDALDALAPYGKKADHLNAVARFVVDRKY